MALAFEWRAGRIYGAVVDTRRLAKMEDPISPRELVDFVLGAPAAHDLRRLRVRMTPAGSELRAPIHVSRDQLALDGVRAPALEAIRPARRPEAVRAS